MREYQRSFGKSYMIVTGEKIDWGYELYMIKNNKISGCIPLQTLAADGKLQFWYDITGKSSMDMYMKDHKADGKLLLKLIQALSNTCRVMSEYLLAEDGICLEPDGIFIGNTEDKFYFCYQPFQKNNFEKGFLALLEFYLQKMEHTNQNAVRVCYDIYDRCAAGNFQLEDLVKCFYQNNLYLHENEEKNPDIQKQNINKTEIPKMDIETNGQKEKTKRFSGNDFYKKILSGKSKRQKDINIQSVITRCRKNVRHKWKKEDSEVLMFEPMEEAVPASDQNPTVFLGSESAEILGQLKYEGKEYGDNFYIDKTPFIIGSKKEEADGILLSVTVSRFHARITKDEEGYYIEDMNSTNGTFLNGEILNYREKMRLNKNDKISFADIPYHFV